MKTLACGRCGALLDPDGTCFACGTFGRDVPPGLRSRPARPESAAAPIAAFTRYDLARLVRDGVPPPQLMCGDLLYEAGLHTLTGAPDSGKTTLAYWWALELLRGGKPVVCLDEEAGPEQTAEKLISLGADSLMVESLHYFPFPGRGWGASDIVALAQSVTSIRPGLIIWDSSAAFLARAGLDENAAADVTRFWANVLTPCARRAGAAVVVIDHDAKNGMPSRYSRGSGAKLAAADVAFKIEMIKPFSRTQDGVLKLVVCKDRRGWLHRAHRIHVTRSPLAFDITGDDEAPVGDRPPAQKKLLSVLSEAPATVRSLIDLVNERYGHGLKRETASRALNALLDDGLADKLDQGSGRENLWARSSGSDL